MAKLMYCSSRDTMVEIKFVEEIELKEENSGSFDTLAAGVCFDI